MLNVIDTLKHEHKQMIEILEDAKAMSELGFGTFKLLERAKELIISHLIEEYRHIYPVLRYSNQLKRKYKHTYSSNGYENIKLYRLTQLFFDKYNSEETQSGLEFSIDLSTLIYRLRTSFVKEECLLFERYKQVTHSHFYIGSMN